MYRLNNLDYHIREVDPMQYSLEDSRGNTILIGQTPEHIRRELLEMLKAFSRPIENESTWLDMLNNYSGRGERHG